jgi:lysophospholipase L1-like esterase
MARRGNLIVVFVSVAISLIIAEIAFRLLTPGAQKDDSAWRASITTLNRTLYRRSDDPRLIYEPVPSASVDMPYGRAAFNSASMRDDREHDLAPPPGRRRVALLGDSIAWSEEVALEDSLARAVERASGDEVLAFGVTGYDTAQEAAWYARAVRRFLPQVVIVVYCLNDVEVMSGPFNRFATPEEQRRKLDDEALVERLAPRRAETVEDALDAAARAAPSRLLGRLRALFGRVLYERSADYTDHYRVLYGDEAHRARVRAALAELGAAIRSDGAEAHLVISPILRAWERYHWRDVHAFVAEAARAAGFVVHDPLPSWSAETTPAKLALPGDSLHYSPSGNRWLGAWIARAIGAGGAE